MLELQNLAEDLSSLNNIRFFHEENAFIFEIDSLTNLILERHKQKIFVSLCHRSEPENKIKEVIIELLKILHPTRTQQFFYKVFLLKTSIVISICGSFKELLPKTLYQFQSHALQCLIKAKKGE